MAVQQKSDPDFWNISDHDVRVGYTMTKMISIFKGGTRHSDIPNGLNEWTDEVRTRLRKDIMDAMNAKHVAFLLGSGCSSAYDAGGRQVGILTMQPLAKSLLLDMTSAKRITKSDRARLLASLGLDLGDPKYESNLEALMEVLFSYELVLGASKKPGADKILALIRKIINQVKDHVFQACTQGPYAEGDTTVHETYEHFYRRLVQRDRSLPRPWVFTTNYDLFSETAMDRNGIAYLNGFLGSVERRFNPATFRYALAEQLDLSSRKWNSVDNLVYFAKLHGSINWESRGDGLFPVVETPVTQARSERLLIYPTPAKQNASFASPYSDMFREFQTRVVREQSVLFVLGYSFGDEHVNNIIFQALTVPTFRIVLFVDPNANAMIARLRELDDPRIWIIGTEDPMATWKGHYFSTFVQEIMTGNEDDPAGDAVKLVLEKLLNHPTPGAMGE